MKKGTCKKSLAIILPFIVIVILLAWIVIAAAVDNSKIRSPVSGINYSSNNYSSVHALFNVTFWNSSDASDGSIANASVATFWYNYSATAWDIVGNSTTCKQYGGGTPPTAAVTNVSCYAELNASAWANGTVVKDGYYSVNATIFNTTTGSNNNLIGVKALNLTTIIIDNTAPNQTHFQTLTSGNNYSTKSLSGNLTLNVSAYDVTTGISRVVFRIVNESAAPTSAGNISAIASQEGTSTYWSASINTSHLLNGIYNVTAMVNDTAGNYNSTVNTSSSTPLLKKIVIDNAAPTISHSCTPNPVDEGEVITCTCAGTDWPAGVNSTSFTAKPSTGLSGPGQTTTCTVTDRAGNENTNIFTYTVNGGSGGGGGSTGGAGSGGAGTSGGSGGSTGNGTGSSSSTGNQGGSAGTGPSGQSQGSEGEGSSGGLSAGVIIAIIIAAIVVVVVIVMIKKKGVSQ